MRVIAGEARGRKLLSLDGLHTRPTTDRVKESMFNMISPRIFSARVLDVFAGSGALGIEALSRGASSCVFLENDADALSVIRENLNTVKLSEKAEVHLVDACRFLAQIEMKFDIIFLDPPYDAQLYFPSLSAILQGDILEKDGIIISERRADKELPQVQGLSIVKDRRYGKTAITIYERTDGHD